MRYSFLLAGLTLLLAASQALPQPPPMPAVLYFGPNPYADIRPNQLPKARIARTGDPDFNGAIWVVWQSVVSATPLLTNGQNPPRWDYTVYSSYATLGPASQAYVALYLRSIGR